MTGGQMTAASCSLLAFIAEQPRQAATLATLRKALPALADSMSRRVNNLITGGYLAREAPFGQPVEYLFRKGPPAPRPKREPAPAKKRRAVEPAVAAPPPAPYVGQVAPAPTRDYREPWLERYLTDAGVRRSGLEYRDCPSRRGDRFVYCYRRDAR